MGLKDLNEALDLIDEHGGDFDGKKDLSLIKKSEIALNLKFPPTYKKFLTILGCGDICGLEFYGVINDDFDNSSIPDAIWLTLNERKAGLPDNLIIIYSAGDGLYYALDTNNVDANDENPVIAYDTNGNTKKISDNFGSFILSELKTVL